jgi:hypothetical protein
MEQDQEPLADSHNSIMPSNILKRINALQNLSRLAVPKKAARLEIQRQIRLLAVDLVALCRDDTTSPEYSNLSELARLLENMMAEQAESELPLETTLELDEGRIDNTPVFPGRMAMDIPGHLSRAGRRGVETENEPEIEFNKVMVASLEASDAAYDLLREATGSFDLEHWQIRDMGVRVPILVLTNQVLSERPNVLVLVMVSGTLVSETIRLITDLKNRLAGLRVVVVGPALSKIENLAERLGEVAYSPEPARAAVLAELSIEPLTRMNNTPLRLDMDKLEESVKQTEILETSKPDDDITLEETPGDLPPGSDTGEER